ncbi:ATP-binding cassette domain-containing protein [Ignatzschineria sp. RMDPL8A]|uniref:ABC transporter ATP-binding protein n=1 Tax=Ignatzschineria sp. RMDPL8A TaxID=2999236 RepID=UPI002446720D|nr:ATP-binding cassette domain-containing protein [Ignatzschineria sp. RMDPL8A]MDG9728829.1 ATP-binding cassette domain-containing protein [Ignatzschineria sp. RMDPL8A]
MQESIITMSDITLKFGERIIFKEMDVAIPKGKITAIMGPSGTGKTTLLKLISQQLTPNKGDVTVMGHSLTDISNRDLYALRKQMGVLFQSGALFTDMTVFDNIAFALREHTGLSESMIRTLVLLKLEAVGLRALAGSMPNQLSGGQARRAALARAIALDPTLLLYDEPFAGQDPISMGVLLRLIKNLNDALNLTSVVVSHDVAEVLSIADHVCILSENTIAASGTPDEIRNSDNVWVRQFIHGYFDGPVPFHLPTTPLKEALF